MLNLPTSLGNQVRSIFFLCLILLVTNGFAREYNFQPHPGNEHFGGVVLRLFQDSHGFLWLASEQGAYRYDSYEVKPYQYIPSDSVSLSTSLIKGFYEDAQHRLWLNTSRGGLNRINLVTEQISHFTSIPFNSRFTTPANILEILESTDGAIYAVTEEGINKLVRDSSNQTEKFVRLFPVDSINRTISLTAMPDSLRINGHFFDFFGQLYLFNNRTHGFWKVDAPTVQSVEGTRLFFCRNRGQDDILWTLNSALTLTKLNLRTGAVQSTPLRNYSDNFNKKNIYGLRKTHKSTLWILTKGDGLFQFDWETGQLHRYFDDGTRGAFLGNIIYDFYQDSAGNLWVSTENGIGYASARNAGFHHRRPYPEQDRGYKDNRINSIFQDSTGKLWLGAYENMHWYYPEQDSFELNIGEQLFPEDLQSTIIKKVSDDHRGNLWFGTKRKPLFKYDIRSGEFVTVPIPGDNGRTLVRDIQPRDGGLWFGVDFQDGGLFYYNSAKERFTRSYRTFQNAVNAPSANEITKIFVDSAGRFWLGTWGSGLNLFHPATERFIHFKNITGKPTSLSDDYVTDIAEDADGNLWLCTWSGGVNRIIENEQVENLYAKERYSYRRYNKSDGLPGPQFLNVLPQSNGEIWFSSGYGLCRYSPEMETFRTFTTADGLHSHAFILGASIQAQDGQFYFGTIDGFTYFYPESIRVGQYQPEIVLTSLNVLNEKYPLDTLLHHKDQVRLSYQENFISLKFAALEFNQPENIQYQYQLSGIDNDWVNAGNRRFANYIHLPPGYYQFQVRYRKGTSDWSAQRARLSIVILPPFWKTKWFIWSGVVFILGIIITGVWTVSRFRLKRRIRRLEMQQRLQSERERISRELHDHVGAKLTNMVTGLEIITLYTKKGKKESAIERINQLESHVRSTINDLRQTIWSLKYDASSVALLVEQIREFIHEQLQFREDLTIRCEYDGAENYQLSPLQALNLFRITQEAIMNAVKYANAEQIITEVDTSQDDVLRLCIRDDGDGFNVVEHKRNKEGFGLETMEQRAEKIQADIEIKSEMGTGTQVQVSLPFENKQDKR